MRPGWIKDLDGYILWLERLLEQSGGILRERHFSVEEIEDADGQVVAVRVPEHRLDFPGSGFLSLRLVVDASELEVVDYSFHYEVSGRGPAWRKDLHSDHDRLGPHIHKPPAMGVQQPYELVDLEEALAQVRDELPG